MIGDVIICEILSSSLEPDCNAMTYFTAFSKHSGHTPGSRALMTQKAQWRGRTCRIQIGCKENAGLAPTFVWTSCRILSAAMLPDALQPRNS